MHEIFPTELFFLGNLSDVAVSNWLRATTFFAAFFDGGVRANNTSVSAALEQGAVVITNLDRYSPEEYVHLDNVIDIDSCEEPVPRSGRSLDDPRAGHQKRSRLGRIDDHPPRRMTSERASRIRSLGYVYADRQTERVVKCNLCGSDTHVEISRRDRYGFPAVLQLCAHCGLGFLSPRMTASEYRDFYAEYIDRLSVPITAA